MFNFSLKLCTPSIRTYYSYTISPSFLVEANYIQSNSLQSETTQLDHLTYSEAVALTLSPQLYYDYTYLINSFSCHHSYHNDWNFLLDRLHQYIFQPFLTYCLLNTLKIMDPLDFKRCSLYPLYACMSLFLLLKIHISMNSTSPQHILQCQRV